MKKIMLFTTAIILFCIVPLSNTQAMQHRPERNNTRALEQPYSVLSVFNQAELLDIITALDDLELSGYLLTDNINNPSGPLLARGDEHDTDTTKNDKQQKEKNTWSKDAWGDAEYPQDENDTTVDKKNDKHKKESPWSKDAWGDAEYPED